MIIIHRAIAPFISILLLPQYLMAADVVPFTVKRIKPVGAGYVELVVPGKIQINDQVLPYKDTKYIRITNIDTMTSVAGSTKGCILAYASENYTENISVIEQSCNEILSVLIY